MSKTIAKIDKNQCTGCGLCSEKCPKQCILMFEDEEGFRFPKIDNAKCVGCGLCMATCPASTAADVLYSKYNRSYYCRNFYWYMEFYN